MPFLLLLLLIGGAIFLAVKAANAAATKRERSDMAEIESGTRPEYVYEGHVYSSVTQAARYHGSIGKKIKVSFFKGQTTIAVAIQFEKPRGLEVFRLDPGDIIDVTLVEDPWVLVIEHSSDELDLLQTHPGRNPELVVYQGKRELRDRLLAAKRDAEHGVSEQTTAATERRETRFTVVDASDANEAHDLTDIAGSEHPEEDEADPEFDAILEEIRVAVETDPERGLAMIDHYVGVVGEQRFLRFSRVLAHRRILVGSEEDARSGRYGHTLDEVARELTPRKLELGTKALHDIAAIEREEPNYFYDGDIKETILDAVCHLMERARPGIVQQTLGWTKLDYFGAGRVNSINEKAPGGKEVQRVPEEVKDRVFAVRFKADTIVRSALAMLASGPGSGRGIGFMLFERLPDRSERVIGDRIHVGSVDIGENGDWRYTPKGDGPSMYGGPMFEEG